MRNDVIRMYRDIHSWVGIISGLALFIAFYAGAITMFEAPLQRWASPPSQFGESTPLARTEELVDKVLRQYPEAAKSYQIVLNSGPEQPGRLTWNGQVLGEDDHSEPTVYYADLMQDGSLKVSAQGPSPVAQLVDDLHRQVGLPFAHEISNPIMGVVSLLYCIALVSGIIVLIPTLVKDLFAFRIGKNLKRMWLDLHNLLGLFSLPFHIVMALTAVVFAFHDQFYDALDTFVLGEPSRFTQMPIPEPGPHRTAPLSPGQIVARLGEQVPGFRVTLLNYRAGPDNRLGLRVQGQDSRYGARSTAGGIAEVNPYTGEILANDYLPGQQNAWGATVTGFFALHFGSFGGGVIRWSYFFLGLAGAFLFYTGNLLWLESKRKKRRKRDQEAAVAQASSARILGALTIGVPLGCVAGISLTIAAAKWLPYWVDNPALWHSAIYYVVFLAAIAWALIRGVATAAVELLLAAALMTLMIPVTSLLSLLNAGLGWNHHDYSLTVDLVALAGVLALILLSFKTAARIKRAPEDSIWSVGNDDVSGKGDKEQIGVPSLR